MADDVSNEVLLIEIRHVKEEVSDIKVNVDKINGSVRTNCETIARLDERQSATTRALSALTLISSTIAAAVGSLVR